MSSNLHKTRLSAFYSLCQVASGEMTSLPGHFRSRDVNSCAVTATSCELQPWRNSNLHKTRVSGLLQPLPGDFQSNDITSWSLPVTWNHVTSFPVTWLPPPASYSLVGAQTQNPSLRPSTASCRWLPVKWCHFRVTSSHVRSCDVISCHVTATSCKLQHSRSSNVHKTRVLGLLQPLPGDFRSNDVTSGWFPVMWRHFLSRDCHLLQITVLQELKHTQNPSPRPSTATCRWLPSNDVTSGSLPVTWRHFLSRDCHLMRVTAL